MTDTTTDRGEGGRYPCPVCLWKTLREPYEPKSFVICEACGIEYGYDDDGRTHEELRARWLASGGKYWFVEVSKRHPSPRDKDRRPIPEFIEGQLGSY